MNFFAHKVLHGLKGGMEGLIRAGSRTLGAAAFAGALGSMVAETTAEVMTPLMSPVGHPIGEKLNADDLAFTKDVARLVTAITATVVGVEDIQGALESATTSLDFNFSQTHQLLEKKDGEEDDEVAALTKAMVIE